MSKKRKRDHLRLARALGIPALIWAVCTVNPFLVMAFICSWIALSGSKKSFALGACVLYIIGAVTSSALTLSVALLGNVISLFSGLAGIAGGSAVLIGATVVADLLTAAAAYCSYKGRTELEENERSDKLTSQPIGFFDSSDR